MRHPEYHPTFTADDIAEIRKLCKQRKAPHVKVQRAQIALWLVEDPTMHSTEIATPVGVHPRDRTKVAQTVECTRLFFGRSASGWTSKAFFPLRIEL